MNKFLLKKDESTKGMISISQVTSFLKCRKAWEYGYEKNLTPRIERPYLTIGKLCHQGMQGAMLAKHEGKPFDDMVAAGVNRLNKYYKKYMESIVVMEEELAFFEQTRADSEIIFVNALAAFSPDKYEIVTIGSIPAIELHFCLPMYATKGMHGFIDLIVRDIETKQVWVVDFKFRSSFEDETLEAFNIQNTVYLKAAHKLKIPEITGTLTFQYSNKPPSFPSILKDGKSVSRAKIKTTWDTYSTFVTKIGGDPNAYAEEMIPKLAEIEWAKPVYEVRNEILVNRVWKDIVQEAAYELSRKYKRNIKAMYPMNCRMCSFKELCQAEFRDYDTSYIIQAEFMNRNDVRFDIDDFDDEFEEINVL